MMRSQNGGELHMVILDHPVELDKAINGIRRHKHTCWVRGFIENGEQDEQSKNEAFVTHTAKSRK